MWAAVTSGSKPMKKTEIKALFDLPFNDLLFQAQSTHRAHFDPNAIQVSTLLSVKTGGCSEDCGYCSQSARHETDLEREYLLDVEEVVRSARAAKEKGATRFCMGAAWRGPKQKDMDGIVEMIRAVRGMGMETCVTLGMLKDGQAEQLAEAGLDYYNHNIDTSPEYYPEVISTHTFEDRLDTLNKVRKTGIKVCCGGIIGLGESRQHRAGLIAELAAMDPPPESVPINMLVKVAGTPLANQDDLDPLELVRTIAATRIALPDSVVRLSAGRNEMPESLQALCFFAGANSLFYGDKLLTTPNPANDKDWALFKKLGLYPMELESESESLGQAGNG